MSGTSGVVGRGSTGHEGKSAASMLKHSAMIPVPQESQQPFCDEPDISTNVISL